MELLYIWLIEESMKQEKRVTKPKFENLVSQDQPLITERAADYLGITIHALQDLAYKKLITCYKPTDKRMFFHMKDLNAYAFRNYTSVGSGF